MLHFDEPDCGPHNKELRRLVFDNILGSSTKIYLHNYSPKSIIIINQ